MIQARKLQLVIGKKCNKKQSTKVQKEALKFMYVLFQSSSIVNADFLGKNKFLHNLTINISLVAKF